MFRFSLVEQETEGVGRGNESLWLTVRTLELCETWVRTGPSNLGFRSMKLIRLGQKGKSLCYKSWYKARWSSAKNV